MINKDIIEAFVSIAREKNIDRTNLGTIIEELFMSLIHKKYGEDRENFSVIVNMEKGEILRMISTDPGSKNDVTAWVGRTGNEILSIEELGKKLIFFIRKA